MFDASSASLLWIAFVLCTFGLIYSSSARCCVQYSVVNCFRSLYLWVDLQLIMWAGVCQGGCELLSFFVPLGWFTAPLRGDSGGRELWIAFVLCTFGLIYSLHELRYPLVKVVNCFRSLYLWVDLQPFREKRENDKSCELLSFFVPLGWFTAGPLIRKNTAVLWIAFVLCTFGLIYSAGCVKSKRLAVVNCFRSLYLWVDLQQGGVRAYHARSCELLSFFVPLGWFTALVVSEFAATLLWIAFVLCTFGLIYSIYRI